MEQRSPEWFAARLGRFTGSRFAALMSSGKSRDDLIRDLAWERFTGKPVEKNLKRKKQTNKNHL